jgi:hypothetical protein
VGRECSAAEPVARLDDECAEPGVLEFSCSGDSGETTTHHDDVVLV